MKCEYALNPAAIAICIHCNKPYTIADRDCDEIVAIQSVVMTTEKPMRCCGNGPLPPPTHKLEPI